MHTGRGAQRACLSPPRPAPHKSGLGEEGFDILEHGGPVRPEGQEMVAVHLEDVGLVGEPVEERAAIEVRLRPRVKPTSL
jgi:hypothetical protein